jgi:hypothetical protein
MASGTVELEKRSKQQQQQQQQVSHRLVAEHPEVHYTQITYKTAAAAGSRHDQIERN